METPNVLSAGLRSILVATDFSDHSKKVVEYAFGLQRAYGGTIYLLYVIETTKEIEFAFKQGHYTDVGERMKEWAMNQLLNLVPDESLNDPRIVRIVERGNSSERIAAVARDLAVDLTVLGTHEYGTTHNHFLKSTTDKLLSRLESPVLAVKI
jgi:nucleotide-binding universal stress UspA family protein